MTWLERLPWGVLWEIARYVNTGFEFGRFRIEGVSSAQQIEGMRNDVEMVVVISEAKIGGE